MKIKIKISSNPVRILMVLFLSRIDLGYKILYFYKIERQIIVCELVRKQFDWLNHVEWNVKSKKTRNFESDRIKMSSLR